MTKTTTSIAALAFGFATGLALQAQTVNLATIPGAPEVLTIPHKAHIAGTSVINPTGDHANGVVDLMLRVYADKIGGSPLFQERQTVQVQNGSYIAYIGSATPGGIPASVYNSRGTFWLEADPVGAMTSGATQRTPFTLRRDASTPGTDSITLSFAVDSTICYTCGGAWPVFGGIVYPGNGHATERPSACGGALTYRVDGSPYLCSR
jgi:hypothetical protein